MNEREAEYKIRETGYGLAATLGWRKAVDLLEKVAREIRDGNNGSAS